MIWFRSTNRQNTTEYIKQKPSFVELGRGPICQNLQTHRANRIRICQHLQCATVSYLREGHGVYRLGCSQFFVSEFRWQCRWLNCGASTVSLFLDPLIVPSTALVIRVPTALQSMDTYSWFPFAVVIHHIIHFTCVCLERTTSPVIASSWLLKSALVSLTKTSQLQQILKWYECQSCSLSFFFLSWNVWLSFQFMVSI